MMTNSVDEIRRLRKESNQIVKGSYKPVTLRLEDIDILLAEIDQLIYERDEHKQDSDDAHHELVRMSAQHKRHLQELEQRVAQIVALRERVDVELQLRQAAYVRIRQLELCECGHNRERHAKGWCNIQYEPCKCKGKFVAKY